MVKIVYIVFIVLLALSYLSLVVVEFVLFPPIGIAALVLGWIPALWMVLTLRIRLEVILATVRTAIDTRALRNRYVGAA